MRTARRYRTVTIQAGSETLIAAEPPPANLAEVLAKIHDLRAHQPDKSQVIPTVASRIRRIFLYLKRLRVLSTASAPTRWSGVSPSIVKFSDRSLTIRNHRAHGILRASLCRPMQAEQRPRRLR